MRLELIARGAGVERQVAGVLEVTNGQVSADDGARWLLERFFAVLPGPDGPRQVSPDEGEAFLVACWFSLRGTHLWGELVSDAGRRLSRNQGLKLVKRHAGLGEHPREGR